MTACTFREDVDRHFAGSLPLEAERHLREHLHGCAACRSYYQRHRLLATLDPEALPPEERLGRALGLVSVPPMGLHPQASWSPQRVGVAVTSVLAVAAALAIFLRASAGPGSGEGGFTPRGGGSEVDTSAPRVFVYRVRNGEPPVRASNTLRRGDELAFAYVNRSPGAHLLVFGVDARRRVFWFHPAWTDERENPPAIPLASDGVRHELTEAIAQPFEGPTLELHAVITDHPVAVREVESYLENGPLDFSGFGTHHETLRFRIEE